MEVGSVERLLLAVAIPREMVVIGCVAGMCTDARWWVVEPIR